MKKLFMVSAFAVGSLFIASNAQAQLKIGGKAGLNLTNISQNFDDSDLEFATRMRPAFHIGGILEYGISDKFAIQSGLMYSMKGYSRDLEDGLADGASVDGYDRTSYHFIEIPISATYKISNFQIYAGPYVAVGLGGSNKFDYTITQDGNEIQSDGEISLKPSFGEVSMDDYGDEEDTYNAFDWGLNAGIGYQFGSVLVNAGYSLGLGNNFPAWDNEGFDRADFRESNRVITVSVSYFFLDN